MKSDHDTSCKECQRKLLNWAVVDDTGKFVKFKTCPVYCDKRCHMCGGKLRIKNSKNFKRTVNCESCSWNDTTETPPINPLNRPRNSPKSSVTRSDRPQPKKDFGYRRLTVEEMRRKSIPRAIGSFSAACSSCGVSISTNGTCRCS